MTRFILHSTVLVVLLALPCVAFAQSGYTGSFTHNITPWVNGTEGDEGDDFPCEEFDSIASKDFTFSAGNKVNSPTDLYVHYRVEMSYMTGAVKTIVSSTESTL